MAFTGIKTGTVATKPLSYNQLLKDPKWIALRNQILQKRGNCCQFEKCGKNTNLEVHHGYYGYFGGASKKLPWEYELESLWVLCDDHHDKVHELMGVLHRQIGLLSPAQMEIEVTKVIENFRKLRNKWEKKKLTIVKKEEKRASRYFDFSVIVYTNAKIENEQAREMTSFMDETFPGICFEFQIGDSEDTQVDVQSLHNRDGIKNSKIKKIKNRIDKIQAKVDAKRTEMRL